MRTEAAAKSLKSLAPMCTPLPPLYTTYIQGGTLGAVPPSEDTAAEEAQLQRIVEEAGKLKDLSERLAVFDWLELYKPEAPDYSGAERLQRVEAGDGQA
jgi:hypothetical protein